MAIDSSLSRGLYALLGEPRNSEAALESDRLLDIATLVRTTEFNDIGKIEAAVHARELLAVDRDGVSEFPAFQFKDGKVRTGVAAVLQAAAGAGGWEVFQFLSKPHDLMFGRRPIDVISEAEGRLRLVETEAQKLGTSPRDSRPG
jgi:hypothetical protein